jgi:hypothetical protein
MDGEGSRYFTGRQNTFVGIARPRSVRRNA